MKNHANQFLELVAKAKETIKEISAKELKTLLDEKKTLSVIDVREKEELATGIIPTAIHISKGVIERDIENLIPDVDTPIVVYCSGGFRCALVAKALNDMGYTQVASLDNGLRGWKEEGFMLESPLF